MVSGGVVTIFIAVYGAVISTLALGWNIYKWYCERAIARTLGYFAYGLQIHERGSAIASAIKNAIGGQEAGDLLGATSEE